MIIAKVVMSTALLSLFCILSIFHASNISCRLRHCYSFPIQQWLSQFLPLPYCTGSCFLVQTSSIKTFSAMTFQSSSVMRLLCSVWVSDKPSNSLIYDSFGTPWIVLHLCLQETRPYQHSPLHFFKSCTILGLNACSHGDGL